MIEAHAIREQLVAILDEAVHGATGPVTYFVDNRPDSGLFGCLLGVDSAEASRPVAGTSIAAHVHHVAFAMEASADWIGGDTSGRDWQASWRVGDVDEQIWEALLERLREQDRRLRAAIESGALASSDACGEAVGAIAHVAYHLGSIWQKLAVLRQASGR